MIETKRHSGFSIAEALITMLIIALVLTMTIPVFTKQKRQGTAPSGRWWCMVDASGQQRSLYYMEDYEWADFWQDDGKGDGKGWTGQNADGMCEFRPDANARNFTVTVVGGGGGGASGSTLTIDAEGDTELKATSTGSYDFIPAVSGTYNVVLVGAGGAGGSIFCSDRAGAGGSGAYTFQTVNLTAGQKYTAVVGKGGTPQTGDSNKNGGNGGDTTFTGGSVNLKVTGGIGGFGVITNACVKGNAGSISGFGVAGRVYINGSKQSGSALGCRPSAVGANDCRGGGYWQNADAPTYICTDEWKCNTISNNATQLASVKKLGEPNFGRGGNGGFDDGLTNPSSKIGGIGKDGAVYVTLASGAAGSTTGLSAGSGGLAGGFAFRTFDKLPELVTVRIGRGGAGAITMGTEGDPGEASSFGNLLVAAGGQAGKAKAIVNSSEANNQLAKATDGEKSAFGKQATVTAAINKTSLSGNLNGANLMSTNNGNVEVNYFWEARGLSGPFGGGGAGGSAYRNNSGTTSWGQGGRGHSGIVIVEWN